MAHVVRRTTTSLSPAGVLMWLLNIVGALVFGLLGLRFLFELLGANPGSGLVDWVYQTSYPLVRPFQGIFAIPNIEGNYVFDLTALLATLIYGIIFYVVRSLLHGMDETRTKRVDDVYSDHDDE